MPFKKGDKRPEGSGRQKGYHKGAAMFEELMDRQGGGWDVLASALTSEEEAVRVDAARFCADHAYGKAPQALKHSGLPGQQMITGDFLIALAARINAQRLPT